MIPTKLPVLSPFTDEEYLEGSKLIEGFSGREIKGAILDMLLSKAEKSKDSISFSIEDLYSALNKKQVAKKQLKAEEEHRIKNKIEKKLKEKAAEIEALEQIEKKQDNKQQEEPQIADSKE